VFETVEHTPETVIIEKADTIKVDLYRGNNTNPDEGEFVSSSSVSSVLSEKPNKDRIVVVEETTYRSTLADTTSVEDIVITDTLSTTEPKITTSETTIVLSSESNTNTSNTNDQVNMIPEVAAQTSSSYVEVIDGIEYDINIVSGSDSLAVGTPAADNVAERGGYDNSGLTEAQYNRAVNYFQKDGNGMFYTLVEGVKSHPELRTKGGIAEGLSAEETVYLLMVADLWGGKGQFKEEVAEFINYVNDCDKTLDMSEEIKEIFNRGNINASMDGITGKNANRVLYTELGDCEESNSQVVKSDSRTVTPSTPVSEKFPEFYKLRNTREFAIVLEEEVHEAQVITTTIEEAQPVNIDLMRGNDFDVSAGEVVREGVSVDEIKKLRPNKDREVIISTSKTYSHEEVMSRREQRRAARKANSAAPIVTSAHEI
jgi:3-methyladenine DNA glycosylase AlkC